MADPSDVEAQNLTIAAAFDDGFMTEAGPGGCPTSFAPDFSCPYGIYTSPKEHSAVLTISQGDRVLAERDVPLMAFNYCGIDLARVVVDIGDGGSVVIGPPEYVSPCRSL